MEEVKDKIMSLDFFHRSASKLFHEHNFITDNQIRQIEEIIEELKIEWPKNVCMKIIRSTLDEIVKFLCSKVRELLKIIIGFDESENFSSRKTNIIVNSLRNAIKLTSITELRQQMADEIQDSRKRLCFLLLNKRPQFKKFDIENSLEKTEQ